MTTIPALIEKLRGLKGPDREVDAEIMFDLFAVPTGKKDDGGPVGYLWPEDSPSWNFGIRFPGKDREWFDDVRKGSDRETLLIERDGALVLMNSLRIPPLTASLDAVTALIERELPGWAWKVGTCSVSDDAWLVPDFNSPEHGERLRHELGYATMKAGDVFDVGIDIDLRPSGRPAIALLIAFLEAKKDGPRCI